jgi:hypothetical protein
MYPDCRHLLGYQNLQSVEEQRKKKWQGGEDQSTKHLLLTPNNGTQHVQKFKSEPNSQHMQVFITQELEKICGRHGRINHQNFQNWMLNARGQISDPDFGPTVEMLSVPCTSTSGHVL